MLFKWKRKLYNKNGFTLIELIIVLVILGIILAVTVPGITNYINDNNEVKNDVKIDYLNKATKAYRDNLYINNKWAQGEDIFKNIATDQERQQVLVDAGLIDQLQANIHDNNNYFIWSETKQKWVKEGGSDDAPGGTLEDNTVAGDIDTGNKRGDWVAGLYYYNDIVKGKDGNYYKCINTDPAGTRSNIGPIYIPSIGGIDTCWKRLSIDFDLYSPYETGDIIKYNNKYYKATKFDSSKKWDVYLDESKFLTEQQIIAKLFVEVEWKNDAFVEVI